MSATATAAVGGSASDAEGTAADGDAGAHRTPALCSPPGTTTTAAGSSPTDSTGTKATLQSPVSYSKAPPDAAGPHDGSGAMIAGLPGEQKGGRMGVIWARLRRHLSDKRLADEWIRLAITATVFIGVAGLMTLAQMFSDRWFDLYTRNVMMRSESTASASVFANSAWGGLAVAAYANQTYATDPLFDHLSSVLPDLSGMRGWLPDLLLTSFVGLSLLVTFGCMRCRRIRYQRIVVARRVLWILSLLYLFRMFSFLVTTVPSPIHNCVPKYPQDPAVFLLFLGNMATGKISACTDNIYSGHTTLATVLVFTNLVYSGRWYFALYSFVHAGAVLVAILMTRLHYSVDILMALFMTAFVYCTYHFLLLIHLDVQLVPGKHDMPSGADDGDAQWLRERRLLLRLAGGATMHAIAWMDGMDLRMAPMEGPILAPRAVREAASIGMEEGGGIGGGGGGGGDLYTGRAMSLRASAPANDWHAGRDMSVRASAVADDRHVGCDMSVRASTVADGCISSRHAAARAVDGRGDGMTIIRVGRL